ncbi:acyl-CoA dehydrogenase family protein [Actinokineospora sp. UTMC 2448]|uniref:acyl-CoA dehydrogenase family protein n=1 Tax=Actinokineospora sp. UTMC 2448 TaxID=2268449 RepID=UPI0021648990|nr:acyl-CoA dehydrogenase family protein [Actinokineospora sp. UTMC 2448]UVS79495.1 Acyl-CoA dehydrogenase [Actinokineospora sp. UTMC 2448]
MSASVASPQRVAGGVDIGTVLEVVRGHMGETDEAARFPIEALRAMRESGLLGMLVPAEYGGAGLGIPDMLDVTSSIARECMSAAMVFAMHQQQVFTLCRFARPHTRAALLPRVARGELYLASVTTEAGTGGRLLSAQAALSARDERLAIDRFAPIVTGGAHADGFLITMRAPGARTDNEVSLVYADRADLATAPSGAWNPMGMRATDSRPMRLTGSVPESNVIGGHGRFRHITVTTFGPLAHLGWSASWLGTAAGALERVVRFLRSPEERARRKLDSELLLGRLSAARQAIDTVNALLQHATQVFLSGRDLSTPSCQLLFNALKLTASERCLAAVDELIELLGLRHGYLRDSPLRLERAWRDLRSASLNYANDRLRMADGTLTLMDSEVHLA